MIQTPTPREAGLDAIRGLFLVLMTIHHFDAPIESVTRGFLGFASAASGFIFMSGLLAGFVYSSDLPNQERLIARTWRRAGVIYLFQIGTVFLVTIGIHAAPDLFQSWREHAPLLDSDPRTGLILAGLLLYQPFLLDILPIYVIFLFLTPFVLLALDRGKFPWLLAGSIGLWLLAQLGARNALLDLLPLPDLLDPGFFDPLAWQIVFMGGVLAGYFKRRGGIPWLNLPRGWPIIAASAIIVLILIRRGIISLPELTASGLTDRGKMGGMRLLNVSLLVLLIGWVYDRKTHWFEWRALSFLGRHSLVVFTYHVIAIYLLMPLGPQISTLPEIVQNFLAGILVLSLGLPAWLAERQRYETSQPAGLSQ